MTDPNFATGVRQIRGYLHNRGVVLNRLPNFTRARFYRLPLYPYEVTIVEQNLLPLLALGEFYGVHIELEVEEDEERPTTYVVVTRKNEAVQKEGGNE